MWIEADVERNTRYGKTLFGRMVVDVRAYVRDPPKRRKCRLQPCLSGSRTPLIR